MPKCIPFTEEQQIQSFWSRVNKDGSIPAHCPELGQCWEWIGAITGPMGYGSIRYKGRPRPAHRVSWMINKGDILNGLFVLHYCDNPKCVNPDHLWLGSHAENQIDKIKKQRQSRLNGEENGRHKLTSTQVDDIRIRYASKKISLQGLAKEYGMGKSTIWGIIKNKNWIAK